MDWATEMYSVGKQDVGRIRRISEQGKNAKVPSQIVLGFD